MSEITLYGIDKQIEEVLNNIYTVDEETGEITSDRTEELEALLCQRKDKQIATALWLSEQSYLIENMKSVINAMKGRLEAVQKRKDKIEKYLISSMANDGTVKMANELIEFSVKTTEQTVVEDLEALPDEYKKVTTKVTVTPDKVKIKKSIKDGADVPGAHIEECVHLNIKDGTGRKGLPE